MLVHLIDGSGISDPCEKEPTDAIGHLDIQQREDITQSAQVIYQYMFGLCACAFYELRDFVFPHVLDFTACSEAFCFWAASQSTRNGPSSF